MSKFLDEALNNLSVSDISAEFKEALLFPDYLFMHLSATLWSPGDIPPAQDNYWCINCSSLSSVENVIFLHVYFTFIAYLRTYYNVDLQPFDNMYRIWRNIVEQSFESICLPYPIQCIIFQKSPLIPVLLSVEKWVSLKPVRGCMRDVVLFHYPSTDSIKPAI
jgi:hypothetical protein